MKRIFNIFFASIILATAFITGAQAQTSSPQRVTASIPFTFTTGNKSLPAGKYTISVVNPSSDRKALQIRSLDGRFSAIVLTNAVNGNVSDNSKLVFERYDDRYFFTHAQLAGDSTSLAALRSKAEHKQLLAGAKKKTLVVIAAE
ncbi:MAG TPA: hypothetical protein VFI24_10985 [Pyrinomonadaceae bacterium]|nr:hypothetical protein [Pyrinomonadaceae bacterium]